LSPLRGSPYLTMALRVTHRVISFYSTGHSRLTVASIVSSIVISKFLHYTILENFNLKWIRIQRGVNLGCYWMLFFLLRRVCWPALEECYVVSEPWFLKNLQ
jgi:hypothetical protein